MMVRMSDTSEVMSCVPLRGANVLESVVSCLRNFEISQWFVCVNSVFTREFVRYDFPRLISA